MLYSDTFEVFVMNHVLCLLSILSYNAVDIFLLVSTLGFCIAIHSSVILWKAHATAACCNTFGYMSW